MKNRELKESKVKLKAKLFFKPIIESIDDLDKLEEKEMKKIRPMEILGVIG